VPVPVATPTPPIPTPVHTVAVGESLSLIAEAYSIHTCELANKNSIQSDVIYAGQQLVVPSPGTVSTDCVLEERTVTPLPVEPQPEEAPAALTAPPVATAGDPLADIICALPWPCEQMVRVAHCESGPTDFSLPISGSMAQNGSVYGLFQIHSIHAAKWPDFWTMWGDPVWNAAHAYEIWTQQGMTPWKASRYCWG